MSRRKQKPKKKKPDSIESRKAEIKARKITAYTPTINSILNKLVFPYKLQLGASAEILEELIPKKPLLDQNAMLDVGDKISGMTLDCISTGAIKPEITHISSRHKGSRAIAGNYVYCKIYIPFF